MVGTVAHRSSVMCREALRRKACTNGVYHTRTRITLCAHTLRGVNRRWHGAKPEAELRQPRTLVGWLALRQGEVRHVALLRCALAYAIWVICLSANPRSASLLVLRRSLPPMRLRRAHCPVWRVVGTALPASLARYAFWVRRSIWWWLCAGAARRVPSLPLLEILHWGSLRHHVGGRQRMPLLRGLDTS